MQKIPQRKILLDYFFQLKISFWASISKKKIGIGPVFPRIKSLLGKNPAKIITFGKLSTCENLIWIFSRTKKLPGTIST